MKEKIKYLFTELLCGKLFPVFLLFLMVCAYATQIPDMGFYLDDWVSLTAYDQGGEADLVAYGINDSRPFAAWVTAQFFKLIGTGHLQWQLITLFWRFAAALTSFAILSSVWPEKKAAAGFASLLFGIFPYFSHQPICIAYFMILMQYFVVLLSFLLTVQALLTKNRPKKVILLILSYLTSIFHLSCLEYYLSLEAARLVLIYIVLRRRDNTSVKRRLIKSILIYIPYALILLGILVYRFIYIPSLSTDVRQISLTSKYPGIKLIFHLAELGFQFISESLLGVWYNSINLIGVNFNVRHTQLALGLGLLAAVTVFFVLRSGFGKGADDQKQTDCIEMFVLGAAAMLLGFLPGMAIDAPPSSSSIYSDRFLIPSFWGISVFTVSFLTAFLRGSVVRNILFSVMVFISVFFQIQNAYAYRYSWKNQQQFQWEMKWRMPDLAENTAVIGDGVVSLFMGGWADGSMLIEMYGKNQGINPTPYWYFNIGEDNYLNVIGTDEPIFIRSKMYEFLADSENILLITKPEYGKCAWVLDEADVDNPYLEAAMRQYIPYQNKSRIILDSDYVMPSAVFGSDYVHDWCYYFEKADLAFDRGDYAEVLNLWAELTAKGIKIGNPTEMRPFIKAAAFSGRWDLALEWSDLAHSKEPDRTGDYFENLWQIINRNAPESEGKAEAVRQAGKLFSSGK